MPIPLQFASFHCSQEVFIWPDGVSSSRFHFLIGYVISVQDTEEFAEHLISNACILLSMSAVVVPVSHAYKNMDMARERISLTLELMAMFLSFQMTFSLVTAAVVWAILDSTSGLDPSSDTIAPRYLKLWTVSSFLLSMVMSVLMPLVLFVINWVFSALICIPYAVEASSRWFTNLASSCSCPARPSMSSAKRKFVIVLPPILTVP